MINEVVMARVDALDEGAKDVLQAGSAIEREFSYELIMHVTGYSEEDLLSYLSAFRDSELIYERGIFPESTYIFKHALRVCCSKLLIAHVSFVMFTGFLEDYHHSHF